MPKWVVVGAGLTGATLAERIATERKEDVLVIERRTYVAGTASDYWTQEGLLVQRHGPHVFHTNSEHVWDYVQRFATWRPTSARVVAKVGESYVPLPVGFRGIDILFGPKADALKAALTERFGLGARVPISQLLREPSPALQELAQGIYESIFQGYTLKHWGVLPEGLSSSVTARVPILVGDQPSYHGNRYQAVPEGGYTQMVHNMLDHPLIRVELGQDYRPGRYPDLHTLYTGSVDEFFGYRHGRLPYRSVRFDTLTISKTQYQEHDTINYPNEQLYTRSTELKRLTGQEHPRTAVLYEYPYECGPGDDPLYPVPSPEGKRLYGLYRAEPTDVRFCGRLGEYVYYDMDQAIASALATIKRM